MTMHKAFLLCLRASSMLAILAMLACQADEPGSAPSADTGQRAESQQLGMVLDAIPGTWAIQNAESLSLAPTGEQQGEIWVETEAGTFNLVQAVNDWKERYEAMADGSFLGQLELGSQLGPAYTVRGRYTHEGARVEERRIMAVHPGGAGLVHMIYRYPEESDSQARAQEMFGLFAGLEHLDPGVPSDAG